MDLALDYLQQVHEAVHASAGDSIPELTELSVKVAAVLGLLPPAINPLFTHTLTSNLRLRHRKNLLSDF